MTTVYIKWKLENNIYDKQVKSGTNDQILCPLNECILRVLWVKDKNLKLSWFNSSVRPTNGSDIGLGRTCNVLVMKTLRQEFQVKYPTWYIRNLFLFLMNPYNSDQIVKRFGQMPFRCKIDAGVVVIPRR